MNLTYHKTLSRYFSDKPLYLDEPSQKKPNTRKLVEQPWQQTKGEMWDEVTSTLCDLDFIQAKAAAKMTYELVEDFNEVLNVIPDNQENKKKENERQARIDKYVKDLVSCAKGKISVLDIPESIPPWSDDTLNAEIERLRTSLTRLDVLKSFNKFLGKEAGNLQKYAHELQGLAIQQAWNNYDCGPVGDAATNAPDKILKNLVLRSTPSRPPWQPIPRIIYRLKGHENRVCSVAVTPNGTRGISGSSDGTCILWDLITGRPIFTLKEHKDISDVAITPDGERAFSGYFHECIYWDLTTGSFIKKFEFERTPASDITAVAISNDKKMAGCIYGNECIIWNLKTGKEKRFSINHWGNYLSICYVRNQVIIGCGKEYEVWNLTSGHLISRQNSINTDIQAIDITPDGKFAISSSGHDLII
ncbi:MAG: hypothetical protein NTX61_04005 [Bacteroidetes bacterium]|nr:hypothetical protein [Bacteroidota bacterium]